MKRFCVLICVSVMLALALAGCGNPEARSAEASAYGVTDGVCPVRATVKCDGDGKIVEAKFDEYLGIYDIGRVEERNGKFYAYGVQISDVRDGYAEFVRVGNMKFEYSDGKYVLAELSGEDKSFDAYASTEEGGARYMKFMDEGDFDIVDGEGKDYGVPFNVYDDYKLSKKIWANKLKNGYHEGVEYDNGYKEDIYSLTTHLKNHGFYGYTGEEKPSGKKKTFRVGGYDTLVTLPNFHDYMALAKRAYEAASDKAKSQS